MKQLIVSCILLAACGVAHADLLVAKGAKATVNVEYSYSAVGSKKDKYDPREWNVVRRMQLTAQFVAGKPQERGQLRAVDASQIAEMQSKNETAATAHKKMEPMMNDMMKIVEKCGDNEACIEKAISTYGNNMQMTPEIKSAGRDIEALGKSSGPRYQLWKAVSQKGTYFVDESYSGQTADPACMEKPKQRCSRTETRKGGGDIQTPQGRINASGAMFEVDAQKKDIVMTLPMPMMPLSYNRVVKSDFPDEASGSSQGYMQMKFDSKPLTITIPSDLKNLSGAETMKVDGVEGEGGTLTMKWQLVVQP
jgi:hypothetical protein